MLKFQDIKELSVEEKEKLFKERYVGRLKFIGKQHGIIKKIEALNKNTKPNPERLAVIEGIWGLNLLVENDIPLKYLIVSFEDIYTIEAQVLIDKLIDKAEEIFVLSKRVFTTISEKENSHGLLAVCYLPYKEFQDIQLKKNNIVLVLDGLEIPGNVGTIVRSADATGIDAIIINNRKTRLNHPKLIRSSLGACFTVPIIDSNYDETKKWLKDNKFNIVLTDTRAEKSYFEFDYNNRVAIIMGSEKYGIDESWYEEKYTGISIPMLGECDSLNVGVAATIIMYEASMKNKEFMKR
ncbi:RNA methyltransferase [Clostridium sp. 19966]|uniref:RNA methyltransferase n=1 Tax=Clostridium sp. 19966 TaxID=2768166 RepID=UPI0028DDDB08|nr:RNA methyltransferase [Clostridium sp. 19966]MDT8715192.1 RNA methyltransferase [Clostridium sp. 19966]